MLWAIASATGDSGTANKVDVGDFLAAIPITLIIILWIWSARRKSKAKAAAEARSAAAAPRVTQSRAAQPTPTSRPSSSGSAPKRDPRAERPDPLDLISGDFFLKCLLVYRQVPPPGPAFLNEFLHGDPTAWSEEWEGARNEARKDGVLDASLVKLGVLLDGLVKDGLPAPVIEAAEEAVKVNLTAACVHHAERVLTSRPELREHLAGDPDESFPGWSEDRYIDSVAFLLREEVAPLDAALFSVGTFFDRPGDCVRAAASAIESAASGLTDRPMDELVELLHVMPGGPDALQHQTRRMLAALDTAKLFPAGKPPT